jgi:hypothetical protein
MTILGEIKGDVVFTTPNGISHKPIQVYNTLLDSLYVAMKGKLVIIWQKNRVYYKNYKFFSD